jgi:homoserine kinase type II
MARYSDLTRKDVDELNHYYGLSIVDFHPMEGGAANSSFLCTTKNEKIVVTIFGDKSFSEVYKLEKLLQYLSSYEFPTSRIATLPKNQNQIMILHGKPVLLKKYIAGEVNFTLDKYMLVQVGKAMGKLHKIPTPDFLQNKHSFGIQFFPSIIGKSIDPIYDEWLTERYECLNDCFPKNLPTCLIHGDLFADNVIFKGMVLEALIDFEFACNYYRVFDIGMGIVGMCVEEGNINLESAKALIDGYQKIQSLEDVEIEYLQFFVEYAAIALSCWRFWRYNIYATIPERTKLHYQMVEIANSVNSIPKEVFLKALF